MKTITLAIITLIISFSFTGEGYNPTQNTLYMETMVSNYHSHVFSEEYKGISLEEYLSLQNESDFYKTDSLGNSPYSIALIERLALDSNLLNK